MSDCEEELNVPLVVGLAVGGLVLGVLIIFCCCCRGGGTKQMQQMLLGVRIASVDLA